jgi:hypothetical protein
MDEIEKTLKTALQREPAPSGFADQVLRKASLRSMPVVPPVVPPVIPPLVRWWRMFPVRWALAGVVVVACMVGGVAEHARQQRIRGEQARQQVLLALRITGTKLRLVQKQVVQRQVVEPQVVKPDEGEEHP